MGFTSFAGNLGRKIKTGVSRLGDFVSNKALPGIGKIAGVVQKVGEFGMSPIGQTILQGASRLPVIGGAAAALNSALPAVVEGARFVQDAEALRQKAMGVTAAGGSYTDVGREAFDLAKRGKGMYDQYRG